MVRIIRDIHVRLSDRAYDTLKELEEISGFAGSRLIEETILAISDLMEYFAEFEISMGESIEKRRLSAEESIALFSAFTSAVRTILNRTGYDQVAEGISKSRKRREAREKKPTETASDQNMIRER